MSGLEWPIIICLSIIFVSVLGLIHCGIMLKRSNKVYDFRGELIDLVFIEVEGFKERKELYDKYSYDNMLNKFWVPLTLEDWYEEDEIKVLKGSI
jgi:hypothetical protein